MKDENWFSLLLQEGEGYKVEFKERLANLDREIVAFANGAGGSIFLGISDDNHIKGIEITNSLKSEVLDIARNCDPAIKIELIAHLHADVLEIQVSEGNDKPYRCRDGFFLRTGATSQKLKRDEIVQLIQDSHKIHFDEAVNEAFQYPQDFSHDALQIFLKHCGIVTELPDEAILQSLNVAKIINNKLFFSNAGILFFAKNPQQFYPEAYITAVKYRTSDRFHILDNQNIQGNLVVQIEQALNFTIRNMSASVEFSKEAIRVDRYDYPLIALREAIVNAITHRDYNYDGSHIYIHLYPNHMDIENPGGLHRGLTLESLGKRSVRRNRLIADLLHRAKYAEKMGSGFDRMTEALRENNNPPLEISATNFFDVRFYKRITEIQVANLSPRQMVLYQSFKERNILTKKETAIILNVSEDTALRELKALESLDFIIKTGVGKTTSYQLK